MHCRQHALAHVSLQALPADALAGVGPLLCLFPVTRRSEIGALGEAASVCAECCIDDDGIRESLRFIDDDGITCLRLFLLPDSDYHAWERLREGLPCVSSEVRSSACSRCSEFMRCLGRWFRGDGWMSSLLSIDIGRREVGCGEKLAPRIGAARVSPIGREIACRIARAEGAPLPV